MDAGIEEPRRPKPVTLWFAPLHGVTGRIFRKAWFENFGGIDTALAPFILAVKTEGWKESHFKDLKPEGQAGVALVPQLLGNEADGLILTARVLSSLGYTEVNWNLGCPYPMVTKKRRGAGLLPHPDLVKEILDTACRDAPLPISVKLRLGLHDAREILAIMPVLNEYPLKRVIVHPRVATQMYTGSVDLEGFSRALQLSRHPVVYNGDIKDVQNFNLLGERFPAVNEWMIGRWAIADPFLPALLKGIPLPPDPSASIMTFHDALYRGYQAVLDGPRHVLDKMKEVWTYLGQSFPDASDTLKHLAKSTTLQAYERSVHKLFAEHPYRGLHTTVIRVDNRPY